MSYINGRRVTLETWAERRRDEKVVVRKKRLKLFDGHTPACCCHREGLNQNLGRLLPQRKHGLCLDGCWVGET